MRAIAADRMMGLGDPVGKRGVQEERQLVHTCLGV